MGSTETALFWKVGLRLAMKMAAAGKPEEETVAAVKATMKGITTGDIDVGEALLKADVKQTDSIVDGLFGLITGVPDAIGGLIHAFFGLFK